MHLHASSTLQVRKIVSTPDHKVPIHTQIYPGLLLSTDIYHKINYELLVDYFLEEERNSHMFDSILGKLEAKIE